jgi:hypothetical protein
VFDYEKGDFVFDGDRIRTVQGPEALKQVIIKAQGTERGVYNVYADPDNPEKDHKYGNDAVLLITRRELSAEAKRSEVSRAIRDALIHDPWIYDVTNISVEKNSIDSYKTSASVSTIFDKITVEGVINL